MLNILMLAILTVLSFDLFILGTLVGFFDKKFSLNHIFRFLIATFVTSFFLGSGYLLGTLSTEYLSQYTHWYAATVLFILGLKMVYSAIKQHAEKQLMNPLDNRGLVFLSIMAGLNAFFVGIVLSLMQMGAESIFIGMLIFLAALFLGYLVGFKIRKLIAFKYEFILGLLYVIFAIIIVLN